MFRAIFKFAVVCALAIAAWLAWALLAPVTPRGEVHVMLPAGSSSRRVAAILEQAGVIRSANAFLLLHYARPSRKLKAGEYRFVRTANAEEVLDRIARGDVLSHTVVIPEGFTMFDIAGALQDAGLGSAQDFLKVARTDTALVQEIDPQAKTLEGYLFPDTYEFTRTQSMRDIAAVMVHRFQQEAQKIGLTQNVHEVVTMASIVEKETAIPAERPEVASVYYNRLSKNIALAADPTVVYAALLDGSYRGAIFQSDLQSDSPYNTYRHPGLPPGPIANPGVASLEAAMHPAQTNYLYFVADGTGDGHHLFTSNYQQHERNVAAYRRAMKSRQ